VRGSSATFVRNPDYWENDPLHPGNRLPYLDGLNAIIIEDASTKLAALRTGKIERLFVTGEDAKSLMQTNPELKVRKLMPAVTDVISMQIQQKPFSDIRVRQAMQLGINYREMVDDYYEGDAEVVSWPVTRSVGSDIWLELDEMPSETQELFSYNPERARQLLAEAGYPNGFKTEITAVSWYVDTVSIVKEYWAAIGIDMEINVTEVGAYVQLMLSHTYKDLCASFGYGCTDPYTLWAAYRSDSVYSYSGVNDLYFDETYADILATLNVDERNQKLRDLRIYLLDQVDYIPLPASHTYIFWQPWLKGYSGEYASGRSYGNEGIYKYAWLDQELKRAR